ncbi:DUF4349 domain-containing protein [Hymenobacter sp. HSC-4F20]|uniref:DUF4349 domain-containing protein n=1 Tax=Hymenobacter sp. HSC-4F20 TaxID=2864135 RepID=UPI001C735BAF|nr:DUF4349 domain-containing protein [Hymenobacter sp. HSC-4F20]MBX0290045.1 DUF4349 domain-containing protein [Hymenobacter sp. HSC-4F20]
MKKYVRLLLVLGLMLAGCAQSAEQEEVSTLVAAEAEAAPGAQEPVAAAALPAADVPLSRLWRAAGHPVIYQGRMELEVADFPAATARLDTALARRGAYLTDARETTNAERHQQVLTVRVPSAQFLALTADLTRLGMVHSKEITSHDVARELARHRTRARPIPAVDTAAFTAPEVQLLTEQAALATLHVTYFQPRPATDTSPATAIVPQIQAGLWFGWRVLGILFVGAAYGWPLLLGLACWAAYRWYRGTTSVA